MESDSNAALAERFEWYLEVHRKRMEMLEKLRLPPKTPAPTGLLRLPFEIRLQIYYHCIPRKRVIDVAHPHFIPQWPLDLEHRPQNPDHLEYVQDSEDDVERIQDSEDDVEHIQDSEENVEDNHHLTHDFIASWDLIKNQNSIFLLSKQISEEALDVLYGDNVFKLYLHGEGESYLKMNFSHQNRQRMKYLLLIAQPRGVSYTPKNRVDDVLWRCMLPHLKGLRIVAEQPVEGGSYYGAPTHKQEMDCWINWFPPYMQCFGQYLVRETKIGVDADDHAETEELVKKCLPYGYQKIQCRLVGDFIFKRGQYSWESGYWDDDGPMNSRDADGDWESD